MQKSVRNCRGRCLFLACDEASCIIGSEIPIDGSAIAIGTGPLWTISGKRA